MYDDKYSRRKLQRMSKKNKPQNTINRQLEPAVERVKEKNDNQIQLGKFFYSIAGMTYAGAVLAQVMEHYYIDIDTLAKGMLATVMFAVTGWVLVKAGNIKR